MFPVQPKTVDALFEAQPEHLRGRLRLDVSSHVGPGEVRAPLDQVAAQTAIAERFLACLAGYVDAVTLEWSDEKEGDWIPVMEIGHRKKDGSYEVHCPPLLLNRMDAVFGLSDAVPSSRAHALDLLGNDFYLWAAKPESKAECEAQGIRIHKQRQHAQIQILGVPYESSRRLLGAAGAARDEPSQSFVKNAQLEL